MRKADVKIAKLREVVEALHSGEEVDVEEALGTRDEKQELEWDKALEEIENEDRIWQNNKKKMKTQQKTEKEREDASPVNPTASENQITPVRKDA